ncbi:MAG: helix-turn-helix transcriptional regulator [Thermoguttaceae bacterium]
MMTPARKAPSPDTYSGRFAIRLRSLREKAGLTVEEVAEKLGVSNRTIYAWEKATNAPHISMFPAIAELYKLKKIREILMNE